MQPYVREHPGLCSSSSARRLGQRDLGQGENRSEMCPQTKKRSNISSSDCCHCCPTPLPSPSQGNVSRERQRGMGSPGDWVGPKRVREAAVNMGRQRGLMGSSTQAQPSTSWCTNRQLLEDMGIRYPAPHNLISHMLLQDGNSALSSAGLRFWMQQGTP